MEPGELNWRLTVKELLPFLIKQNLGSLILAWEMNLPLTRGFWSSQYGFVFHKFLLPIEAIFLVTSLALGCGGDHSILTCWPKYVCCTAEVEVELLI